MEVKRLVIGISGASGAILGIELLRTVRKIPELESHIVISRGAGLTIRQETEYTVENVAALADKVYDISNIGAAIASGTFKTIGMIVVPCSMKTLAGINSGFTDNLLLRAADVTLKERRRLVLVARETPLNTIHLRNLMSLSEMGVVIMPPMLTYYNKPLTIGNMNTHMVGKMLDVFGFEVQDFRRWGGIHEEQTGD